MSENPNNKTEADEISDDVNKTTGSQQNQDLTAFPETNSEYFYDFQLFVKQFKSPEAGPLVKYTKSFLYNFVSQRKAWTAQEQQKLISNFKIFIFGKLKEYAPFTTMDEAHLVNAKEGIEKLVMGKLYTRCFSPNLKALDNLDTEHEQDLFEDAQLETKVDEYKFIKPQYLDIDESVKGSLDKFINISGKELNKINNYKAPRDKMVCILNSCKVVFGILKHNRLEHNGADSFVPLIIYTILKSEIAHLSSNIKYIERFRFDEFLNGEAAYYLSSLQAAVSFIIDLKEEALTITNKDEYQKLYDANKQESLDRKAENKEAPQTLNEAKRFISPTQYLVQPLDEAANTLMNKFNELFISGSPTEEADADRSETNELLNENIDNIDELNNDYDVTVIAEMLEKQEHQNVVESLQSMFPDMDTGLIEDVCFVKKYRLGDCVDCLLSLSE